MLTNEGFLTLRLRSCGGHYKWPCVSVSGGKLIFDRESDDVELHAERILITAGGLLEVRLNRIQSS